MSLTPAPTRTQARAAWAAGAALVGLATLVVLVLERSPAPAYAGLAVFLAANAAFLLPSTPGRALARGYLAVASLAVLVVVHLVPDGWAPLVLLVPQVFALLERTRIAVAASVGLLTAVLLVSGSDTAGAGDARWVDLVLSAVAVATAVTLGWFVKALLGETHRRGRLVRELTETRRELAEAQHEAGAAAERARLAREIHDTLAQGFASLVVLVQAAEASLDSDPVLTRERLSLAEHTARENLAEARALVAGEGPAALREHGLAEALNRLAASTEDATSMTVQVEIMGEDRPVDPAGQVVALRVVQEALTNIRRHAAAHAVHVRLSLGRGTLDLEIRDDGKGFDVGTTVPGVGMTGMRERVESTGGSLDLRTAPGAGTTLTARIPG